MAKRDDILATATRLFGEYGYHAVGVDRIRDEACVSKMTLYHHFPGKEALVEAVLAQRHERFMASLGAVVESMRTPDERLRAVFDWHARWFASEHFHGCMFIKATEEYARQPEALLALSRRHKDEVAELVEGILAEYEGEAVTGLARLVQVTLDGMIVNAYLFGPEAVDDAWAALAPLLGLDARPLAREGDVGWSLP
ncbi:MULTISPECIES: TetR/AcrR family transcriptional regulator [unclassified Modicisalibacter]|uniref:TetR/AcrR family transcriptional regulator n=1 Tax=unclassified Modicisalibacter TaxID=2679913 RepID=UPI001CCF92AE|nr:MULTISPECIES: TetR/AcrR family transcriptional regulator [unclassified Modicisalibacter]MBZ9559714.1 TetR/AcrR family transcriptional regulator [Modicisalibacter sp. R2A 31.J]MBZ9577166.1 TetR/AcrR family transcriptional regulator [Modicisalibacter sp. MOD 31.J]